MSSLAHLPIFGFCVCLLLLLAIIIFVVPFKTKLVGVHRIYLIAVVLMFIGSSLGLYLAWGEPAGLYHRSKIQAVDNILLDKINSGELDQNNLDATFRELGYKIDKSHYALAQLGKYALQANQASLAEQFYFQALQLQAEEEYINQWIYSHSVANKGRLSKTLRNKSQAYLKSHNDPFPLINLLAIDDFVQGNYQQAKASFEYILHNDENLGAEQKLLLKQAINSCEPVSSEHQKFVSVLVELDEAKFSNLDPNLPVFVVAKPVDSEQRMPLAVKRLKLSDLPVRVNFTDEDAMLAGKGISSVAAVNITARVAISGDPIAKVGDLEGVKNKIVVQSDLENALQQSEQVISKVLIDQKIK